MTEVAEGVAMLADFMDKDDKCEFKPEKTNWKCKLDGDSDLLSKNIVRHRDDVAEPARPASLSDVSATCWLYQAHHLIPWQQLQKHPAAQWVEADKETIVSDNRYSVDHGNNGKFMPYASALPEWNGASRERKREIAEEVMRAAGIQLHQGPHSYKQYGVGEDGYKTRVAKYLAKINNNSLDHYSRKPKCPDCAAKKGKLPRANVVRALDKASSLLDKDIVAGRIYVSRRAADFVAAGGTFN